MILLKNFFYETITILLLLVVLFFPTKFFSLYYTLITLLSILVFILAKFEVRRTIYLTLFLSLVGVIFVNSSLSSIYFGSSFPRNVTEMVRFFPIVVILSSYRFFIISFSKFYFILMLYVVLASFVNIFQFLNFSFINKISEIYNDPDHIQNSLELSSRSLGLSGGPGPNGIIFVVLFVFFLTSFLSKRYKISSLIMMLLSLISIFCSQSQTAFVALALVVFFVFVVWFLNNYNKKYFYKNFSILILTLSSGFIYFSDEIKSLSYLNTLFDLGLERSSYQNREVKFNETIDVIGNNYLFSFLGHGKDYIPNSSALDNEYLFIFSVYGFLGFILIVFFYFYNIVYIYFKGSENIFKYLIVFTSFSGLIIAWPSSFILDPRILFILCLYIVCYLQAAKVSES